MGTLLGMVLKVKQVDRVRFTLIVFSKLKHRTFFFLCSPIKVKVCAFNILMSTDVDVFARGWLLSEHQ